MVTPASIDGSAVAYAVAAEAAEPNDFAGYPSLAKAEKLARDVDEAHNKVQLRLRQQIETDNLDYSVHKGVVATAVEKGQALEEKLFGPSGLLSMGLAAIGFGGFGGVIGLLRKRPQDWTQEEVDGALEEAGVEASAKTTQLVEIVKAVEAFKNGAGAGAWAVLKPYLLDKTSAGTKEEVAKITATL
jgi:hypothetical protein